MVATGYEYGVSDVVHADIIQENHMLDNRNHQKLTPRLEMNELFFGDSFGEPLDLLDGDQFQNKAVA